MKPKLEIQLEEETQTLIEQLKPEQIKRMTPPENLGGDKNVFGIYQNQKVETYIYKFDHGLVVGRKSLLWRFRNSCFGKFIVFLSYFFGMSIFWDNLYHACMVTVRPRVVVKISMKPEFKYQFHQATHEGECEDATDAVPKDDLPWMHPYFRPPYWCTILAGEQPQEVHNAYLPNSNLHPEAYQPGYPTPAVPEQGPPPVYTDSFRSPPCCCDCLVHYP